MTTTMREWKKLGQILIENEILSVKTADRVLAISSIHNKRFGWTLEKLGLATGEEIAAALAQQYNLKIASNLIRFSYSQEVLQLITCEFAVQNLVFPLRLDKGKLLLAVADPTNMKLIENMAVNCGVQISICLATRNDIYEAICKFYLNKRVEEQSRDTVLVVDDDQVSRELVKFNLVDAGYNVIVANDGLEGFNKIISERPHVIITDKVMPKFDGFFLLKSIKSIPEFESVPVILMSDKLLPNEELELFEMGFFDYIPKPFKSVPLLSRVRRAFRFNTRKYDFF
jgi:CheY-like chemotaxis protein